MDHVIHSNSMEFPRQVPTTGCLVGLVQDRTALQNTAHNHTHYQYRQEHPTDMATCGHIGF